MPKTFDITIIGAGVAGTVAAVGLARDGHRATVLDRRFESVLNNEIANAIIVPPNAGRVLDRYGLLSLVKDYASSTSDLSWKRYDDGTELLSMRSDDVKPYGYPNYNVVREQYTPLSIAYARMMGVVFHFDCHVSQLNESEQGAIIRFEDGTVIRSDLLIGVDGEFGIGSITRKRLIPGGDVLASCSRNSYTCRVPAATMREERLGDLVDVFSFWIGPGRILAARPFPDFYDMHLHHPSDDVSPEEFAQTASIAEMMERFKYFEPHVKTMLNHVHDCKYWSLKDLPSLQTWVSPCSKAVIIGDAAHAMLPNAGQGAGMGIEDAAALTMCLARAETKKDFPKVFRAFEKIRKPRAESVSNFARMGSEVWTFSDGEKQQGRDKKWEAERLVFERKREARKAGEKEWELNAMGSILEHDIFEDVHKQLAKMEML